MTFLPGPDTLVYNSTPPSPADGEEVPLQGDSQGNLKVSVENTIVTSGTVVADQGTDPWIVSISGTPTISGTVSISGTPTISGTVTANAGTNLNTSLLALESGGNLAGLVTRIGEVQTSPTANTVLDRLKALLTGIVLSTGSNVVGKVGIDQTTPGTTNAVQATNFPTGLTATGNALDVNLKTPTTVPISASALPLPSGAATEATLGGVLTTSDFDSKTGSLTEAAPATDTASSGINGRLQRIAQRLTSLIALVPSALTGSGNFKVALVESTVTQPVSGTITATGTVAATQSGNWTARVVGNGGATLDATIGAGTAPTNMLVGGALYNSTEISPASGQSFALQGDAKGRLREVIMDGAGNTRAANVNASNQLSVSTDGDAFSYAQGSTTSGQSGRLGQGAATTSAPNYTSGQTDPLSLTTLGGLREAAIDADGHEFDYTAPTQVVGTLLNPSDLTSVVVNIASATTTAIVAAVANQSTRVHRMRLNVAAAQTITVKDGSTTLEVLNFTSAGFLTYDESNRPWYTTSQNSALNFTTSGTAQVNGVVEYQTGL